MGGGRDKDGVAIYRRRNGKYERIDGKQMKHRLQSFVDTENAMVAAESKPKTLQNFTGYADESKKIMDGLSPKTKPLVNKGMQNIQNAIDKLEFRKRISEKTVSRILKSGRIKSFLETGTSMSGDSDDKYKQERLEFSKETYGHDGNLAPEEYENYGYLGNESAAADSYGDLDIVFKKDSLFDITTISFGDSLQGNLMPSFVSNPGIASFFKKGKDFMSLPEARKFYKASQELLKTGYPSELGYAELQFHGLLTNDKIDHFSVPKFWKGDPKHESTIREIESYGFKVTYDNEL